MVTIKAPIRDKIPSLSEAQEFINAARGLDISLDTETTGLLIRDFRDFTQGLSIGYRAADSFGGVRSFYFPFDHTYGENYPRTLLDPIRDLVESAPTITFHNAKFDIVALRQLGIYVRSGSWICTMIMAHLINENFPYSKSLDSCLEYYQVGHLKEMPEEMAAIVNNKALGWKYVPAELMWDYAAQDAAVTILLREKLWPLFKAEQLDIYWPHKARLIEVVIEMESRGVRIDKEFCARQVDAAEQAMQDYSELLGWRNPASPKDMKALLIDELGLPIVKRSAKTGAPSFDKEAMLIYEQILANHDEPLAQYILGYRGWAKSRTAFYGAYLDLVSPDGRIRPSYKHHKDETEGGTVTGRLSCAEPNLQQIPRVTDKPWNGQVKRSFIGSDGYSLWEADYAQLELRLGTAYADEPTLKQVFIEGRDIFLEMATTLGWERNPTKGFVYSTQYGAGKTRISQVFGVTEQAGQQLINQYYQTYPKFKVVSDMSKAKVLSARKLRLWSGRYRHFARPRDENHKAFNSLIQGGAADIVERVMVRLFDEVDQKSNGEVRMLLQVHDSVIFEIKNGREDYWRPIIVGIMEDVNNICVNFDVVFAVDFHQFGLAA